MQIVDKGEKNIGETEDRIFFSKKEENHHNPKDYLQIKIHLIFKRMRHCTD
jgi:hypothetical protein